MTALLAAIGYQHWVVHVLLVLPLLGMPLILFFPARFAKWIALTVALLELVVGDRALVGVRSVAARRCSS